MTQRDSYARNSLERRQEAASHVYHADTPMLTLFRGFGILTEDCGLLPWLAVRVRSRAYRYAPLAGVSNAHVVIWWRSTGVKR